MTNQLTALYLSLKRVIDPLRSRLSSLEGMEFLFHRYGWRITLDDLVFAKINDLLQIQAPIEQFLELAERLESALEADPETSLGIEDGADIARSATRLVRALADFKLSALADLPAPLADQEFWRSIGDHLLDDLLEEYLRLYHPVAYGGLHFWGIIRYEPTEPNGPFRKPYDRIRIEWEQLLETVKNPLDALTRAYRWNDRAHPFEHRRLLEAAARTLRAFGVPAALMVPDQRRHVAEPPERRDRILRNSDALRTRWCYGYSTSDRILYEIGCDVFPAASTDQPAVSGLVFMPILRGGTGRTLSLGEHLRLRWNVDAAIGDLISIACFPNHIGFIGGEAALDTVVEITSAGTTPRYLLGNARTSRIELRGFVLQASLHGSADDPEFAARFTAAGTEGQPGCKIVLSLGEADGFLQSTLPQRTIELSCSPEIAWSSKTGLTFGGRPTIAFDLPLQTRVGPFTVTQVTVAVTNRPPRAGATSFACEVGADIRGSLGPVDVVVQNLGCACMVTAYGREALLALPQDSDGPALGNLGVDLRFKPPTGLGLAITTAGVTGGGFLGFDPQRAEYSGILQLELAETIAIKALGLLTTKLPDGSKGFSLVILLTAEGFAPIPVGLGFTLTGIGGLVALHRTVRTDVLRDGLKTGTLNSILFPSDPLRNAPQIFSDLRRVFPPTAGRHVVGPMVQLRWGTPTLLTLDLALLVELPSPVRVVVLGRLQVLLPSQAHPLVQIRMDALGVLDVSAETVSLDATLYDSKILQFPLTGDMALRAGWGRQPQFVLAIGGFHPRFAPPPGLPALQRLALQLADGDSLQLRCQAYLAVTSNTVQFGARVDLHAAGGGFSFDGMLGFDAILQLAPLAFEVDVGAALALRYHGRLLMGISFKGRLAGPTPWQVAGKAKIKLLFFSVSVSFSRTFGSRTAPPLPAAVDVVGLIAAALADRLNWSSAVPRNSSPVVTFRETAPPANGLRVHPWAELTLRERIAPLNRPLTKLGTAPLVGGPTMVTVSLTDRAGAQPWRTTPVHEPFALAQYEDLREDEQLAQPAFVPLQGGLTVAADDLAVDDDAGLATPIAYETLLIDPTRPPERPKPGYVLSAAVLARVAPFGAAGQAPARRRRRGKTAVLA
ncbi:MAG: hypothetical protein IPO99_11290 [Nitrospira sp.]|nr:hypothetical protein [Nitrospira sp.]